MTIKFNSQVCKDDKVIVDLVNKQYSDTETLHWHGLTQKASPHMDGVPFVTQCPLGHGTFRYQFNASEAGTMFWHSHSGEYNFNEIYKI